MSVFKQPSGQSGPADTDLIYARFSSDNQRPTSIEDQVGSIQDYAARRHDCRPEFVIADEGESVKTGTAPNWERVLELVRTGQVKRVFVDESSRITRELQSLLQVQAVFRHYGVALICVQEDIDLTDDRADLQVIFGGFKNQAASRDGRHRIRRSMDGNLKRNLSNGDLAHGYTSVRLTDQEIQKRGLPPRGPDDRPYKKQVIVPAEASVIRKIHRWFAINKMSIRQITRRLNRSGVPRGGKARTKTWKQVHVRKILGNRRYLGYRVRNETMVARNPETGRREVRKQEASKRIEIHDPTLVILTAAEFAATARRLEDLRETYGSGKGWQRGAKTPSDYAPRHLFSGTLVCGLCCTKLSQTAGHAGGYYGCPAAAIGKCTNSVRANRRLAEQLLLQAIVAEFGLPMVVDRTHELLKLEIEAQDATQPEQVAQLEEAIHCIDRELSRLVDSIVAAGDSATLGAAIRDRENRKRALEVELSALQAARPVPGDPPDRDWVERQLLHHLPDLAAEDPRRAALAIREVTGSIAVFPDRKPWLRQHHLVARFQVDIAAAAGLTEDVAATCSGFGTSLEVALRMVPFYEEYGAEVIRLRDEQGLNLRQIAEILPVDVSPATVKIAYNFGKYGTPDPGDRAWKNRCRRRTA